MRAKRTTKQTEQLVLAAALTAMVVVLQLIATVSKVFLGLAINLSLIPIVVGAAIGGVWLGAWLGFASGVAVLITGEAAPFLALNVPATLAMVLLKSMLAGIASALVYKLLVNKGKKLAVYLSATVCPVVNSSVFVILCTAFFKEIINEWGAAANVDNAFTYFLFVVVLINFTLELIFNIVLSPYVVRLIEIRKKK